MEGGATKSGDEWKKCWTDQKYLMKKSSRLEETKTEQLKDNHQSNRPRYHVTPLQKLKLFDFFETNKEL